MYKSYGLHLLQLFVAAFTNVRMVKPVQVAHDAEFGVNGGGASLGLGKDLKHFVLCKTVSRKVAEELEMFCGCPL